MSTRDGNKVASFVAGGRERGITQLTAIRGSTGCFVVVESRNETHLVPVSKTAAMELVRKCACGFSVTLNTRCQAILQKQGHAPPVDRLRA